jgi:large subunit ribosomal protein L18
MANKFVGRAPQGARPPRDQAAPTARPRLSVFRSSKQIYAQVIDDAKGRTLAAASSLEKDLREAEDRRRQVDAAKRGRQAGRRARKAAGVKEVVFDRGGYMYHGRVKALADAAREGGLDF